MQISRATETEGEHRGTQRVGAGTIILPTAAVAPLKQALRKAQNEMYDAILAVAKLWEPRYVDQEPRRG